MVDTNIEKNTQKKKKSNARVERSIPTWARSVISSELSGRIEKKVSDLEAKLHVECVPMLVARSSPIGHVPLMVYMSSILFLIPALYLAKLDVSFVYTWGGGWQLRLFIGAMIVLWPISIALSKLSFLRRLFTPFQDRCHNVEKRAALEFFQSGLGRHPNQNGVLIMFSLLERRVAVVCDEVVKELVSQEQWLEIVRKINAKSKKNGLAYAFEYSVDKIIRSLEQGGFEPLPPCEHKLANSIVILR
jgi:putative membrane protein